MAEENQQQVTTYKRTTTSAMSNERTATSNYERSKESRSW